MSFYDLEYELPKWLDDVISDNFQFQVLDNLSDIKKLDGRLCDSYHCFRTQKGNMENIDNLYKIHSIWKYQNPKIRNRYDYGKYLKYIDKENKEILFWIGLSIDKNIMDFYLWFGLECPVSGKLKVELKEEKDERYNEYWYRNKHSEAEPISEMLAKYCGCDSFPLKPDEMNSLEENVKKALKGLLDVLKES